MVAFGIDFGSFQQFSIIITTPTNSYPVCYV